MLELQKATTPKQLKRCFPIILQLRPHLMEKDFIEQVFRQIHSGYTLFYLESDQEIKAIAGFRILEFLAWGKVLYIDDLITDKESRNKGYAGNLLKSLISLAKEEKCDQVHLDSGPQRHDAHRLYLNHGLKLNSHHFVLDLRNS